MSKSVIQDEFKKYRASLDGFINNFDSQGKLFIKQNRNSLKTFEMDGLVLNIKSFKIPNPVNQIVYRFFRKGKASALL